MDYSPTLAVGTAGFEILAALWAFSLVWSRRASEGRLGGPERRIAATTGLILLLLAGYQMTEVAICIDVGSAGFLPRLAFIIVTWLPALGLLLIAQIQRPRAASFYAVAAGMLAASAGIVAWISLDAAFASASVCNAVYARYAHAMPRFQIYGAYYWAGLLGMVLLSGYGLRSGEDVGRRRLQGHVLLGTLGFVLPSIAVSYAIPTTRNALPSVLCHFALVLALFLTHMLWELRARALGATELTNSAPGARI